ncbi:MAG: ATP-binding protein, partial [Acidobacteria bacterium]|nr:ATP-binding protein [Acidobacteriota bacterium]
MNRTIRAHVDPAAISRVSRFFDASNTQIVHEMLQNARRAGATRVLVDVGPSHVSIANNGRGIADPAILLAFGATGWDETTTRNEDPAGMGVFSLARRNAVIDSAPAPEGEPWHIELQPEHFLGQREAEVRPGGQAPSPHGTRVSFSHRGESAAIREAVRAAARYGPLDVTLDNEPVERADFLSEGHVVHTETHGGVRIEVRHSPTAAWDRPRVNLHGLQIDCEHLPTIMPVDERGGLAADPWWVMVDVIEAPELELVLPARKQVVRNAFLQRLAQSCRAAIFRAIRDHGKETRLKRADALEAKECGVRLPAPLPELHAWKPRTANDWEWDPSLHRRTLPVGSTDGAVPLLMTARLDAPSQQVLARTLEVNGMREQVFHPKPG